MTEKFVPHPLVCFFFDDVGADRGHPVELAGAHHHAVVRALHGVVDIVNRQRSGLKKRSAWFGRSRNLRRRVLFGLRSFALSADALTNNALKPSNQTSRDRDIERVLIPST
ncbi:MAG: hypothetical protein WBG86_05320 [Polyangiales bacterium]